MAATEDNPGRIATENERNGLTGSDLANIEYLLKCRLAERFGSIQAGRANQDSSHNVGNARKYVQEARTLRRVLQERGRQSYQPLREIHGGSNWLCEERQERVDVGTADPLIEVCEAIDATGYIPAEERRTLTDHDSVPGVEGR